MIEFAAPLLIAPDILSLIPSLEEAPVESNSSSVPVEQNFSALLTELVGPVKEKEEKGKVKTGGNNEAETTPEHPSVPVMVSDLTQPQVPSSMRRGGADGVVNQEQSSKESLSEPATPAPRATPPHQRVELVFADLKHFEYVVQQEPAAQTAKPVVVIEPPQVPSSMRTGGADGVVSHEQSSDESLSEPTIPALRATPPYQGGELPSAELKRFEYAVQQEPQKPVPQDVNPASLAEQTAKPVGVIASDPIINARQDQPAPRTVPLPAIGVGRETARPQDTNVAAVPVETRKQIIAITTDPIANTQQEQLPLGIVSLQKANVEARLPERSKPQLETGKTETTTATPTIHFQDLTRPLEPIEQVRPAHYVEIPATPQLQVIRTVSMEVGEADSQVVIRIQERGGDVALQINAAAEPLHHELQTSVNSLVHALRREEVHISSIEVTRKQPIDRVRRAKEAH